MNQTMQFMAIIFFAGSYMCRAALTLNGTSYNQTFDDIGNGLPDGWSLYTAATASSLGTAVMRAPTMDTWGESSGGFYNVASADGLSSGSSTTQQKNSTDRALAVKQVGSGGYDSGAAIVLQIQNTAGLGNFSLSLEAQILNEQSRSTTWYFQYRLGDSGNFATLGAFNDPGVWGFTTISFNCNDLGAWDNQSSDIWFRIAALTLSSGSGSRDMFAIDDFSLTYSSLSHLAVPEPDGQGLVAAALPLILCSLLLWRQRRAQRDLIIIR